MSMIYEQHTYAGVRSVVYVNTAQPLTTVGGELDDPSVDR